MIINKKKILYIHYILIIAASLTASCQNEKEDEINRIASSFALKFFNCQFNDAYSYCTEESEKWIAFQASNITEKDLEILNSSPNSINAEVYDIQHINDTSANAILYIKNSLSTEYLEQTGIISDKKKYVIPLVFRNSKWLVKMEGPLQSAK